MQREVLISLVRCIASKKNPRSGRSSSSPCQPQDVSSLLPPPSPPSLPVGALLVSGVVWTYPVPLWRCTAVKHLSGTLPTPCLDLTLGCLQSPSLAPATYWGEMMLMTSLQLLSIMLPLPPSFRKPPHLHVLPSQLAPHQSGRPLSSLTPHRSGVLQLV